MAILTLVPHRTSRAVRTTCTAYVLRRVSETLPGAVYGLPEMRDYEDSNLNACSSSNSQRIGQALDRIAG